MVKDGILFSKSGDELVIYPAERRTKRIGFRKDAQKSQIMHSGA